MSKKTQQQASTRATATAKASAAAKTAASRATVPFSGVDTSNIGGLVGQAPAPVVPLPPDPNVELAKLQAGMNIGLSGAEGAWQTGQLQRSSGFDASGNLVTGGQDYNPFAQAMLLQDAYKRDKLGTSGNYAARGQYASGAYGSEQALNDTGYAQNYDALRTSALQGYHGIGANQLQTYANNAIGGTGAEWQSLYKNVYGG